MSKSVLYIHAEYSVLVALRAFLGDPGGYAHGVHEAPADPGAEPPAAPRRAHADRGAHALAEHPGAPGLPRRGAPSPPQLMRFHKCT